VSRGLLGTSVLIAQEGQRLDISALPDEVAVSVVTYGELRAGVLAATDVSVRSRRLSTLQTVAELGPLPVDTAVADECARLRLLLATAGRRVNVIDTRIATTALAHDVRVVTRTPTTRPSQGSATSASSPSDPARPLCDAP
jgi:predicted nucleic acid-binding protein